MLVDSFQGVLSWTVASAKKTFGGLTGYRTSNRDVFILQNTRRGAVLLVVQSVVLLVDRY